jgi:ComF family protein
MQMLRSSRLFAKFIGPVNVRRALASFRTLGQALDTLVFPWACLLCGREGLSEPFCQSCRGELMEHSARTAASACPRCALPVGPYGKIEEGCSVCRGRSLGFDAALAFGPYDQSIRELCLRLKRERNAWLAPWLSDLLVESRRDSLESLPPDTWVVPVPLHRWRYWQRGYDQAEALARGLAQRLRLRVYLPLRRVAATPKLAELGLTERSEVMRRAFSTRRCPKLNGRPVLLVDDVLTTGATCGDAARALKRAGATRVVAVVFARAERRSS